MKYVWHNGQWCEAVKAPYVPRFPAIHRDTMSVGHHPGTGKITDSKSAWRRMNRETGMIELGNDVPTQRVADAQPIIGENDVAAAVQMLEQGYRPDPLPGMFDGDFADAEVRTL